MDKTKGFIIDVATLPDDISIEDIVDYCKNNALAFGEKGHIEYLKKFFKGDTHEACPDFYQEVRVYKSRESA